MKTIAEIQKKYSTAEILQHRTLKTPRNDAQIDQLFFVFEKDSSSSTNSLGILIQLTEANL